VIVGCRRQPQLSEDAVDVRLHGLRTEEEALLAVAPLAFALFKRVSFQLR
jgi:hypothetical protein